MMTREQSEAAGLPAFYPDKWLLSFVIACLLTCSAALGAQTVTGTVTAEEGEPLIGVSITVAGKSTGTVTDLDGSYSLTVAPEDVLQFSYTGYRREEVPVNGRSQIDVVLATDVALLDEIVVVGYGTQRKEDLTGSVSVVNTEEMAKQASNDVTQMMQGRVAGVSITSDGQPGAAPNVRIRGVSTFGLGAGAEPLYVVDGFPLAGGIRDINPNDIESIQILKDATSGAIYGNRAANGVVIITTKSGAKNRKFGVSFSAYAGLQTVPQRLPVLDRVGYQTISNELLANGGQAAVPGNNPSSPSYINNIDTDWQDAGYKDGSIQNYNLGLSGGTSNLNYFVSLDYLDNKGTLVGSGPDYKRYSARVNSELDLGRVRFGENIYAMRSDENPLFFTGPFSLFLPGGRSTLVNDLLQAIPTIPVEDPNREGGFGGADAVIHQSITLNVPGFNTLVTNSSKVNRLLANVYGEVDLLDALTFKTSLQYDNTDITDELFAPQYDLGYFFPRPIAELQVGDRSGNSFLVENTLTYQNVIGKHDLTVLAGQSFQEFNFRQITAVGSGLEKPYIRSLSNASTFSVTDNQQPATLASFLGRIAYAYDDTYLLTFNIRRDGSSRFREEDRFAVFPSIGLGWKLHKTLPLPEAVTGLKLRGGYGELGNQEIGNFRYQATINRAIPYEFSTGRVFGAATTLLVDPAITWETRVTRNVGLDLELMDGQVEFTAEYYSNTSKDVLIDLPIPLSNGSLGGLTTNAGSIENSGIELSGSWHPTVGPVRLSISPNFYTVKNKVLDIGTLDLISGAGSRTEVGQAIGQHYGWVYEGIFQSEQEVAEAPFQTEGTSAGDIRFADLTGDGVVDEADRQYLGSGLPTYYYGLNFVAEYRNFDFTVFGQGSGGNLINSNLYRGLMPTTGYNNRHEDILNRWTPTNTTTDVPRVVINDPNNNHRDSDRPGWLQDGDYFRINTLSLGYTLPAGLLRKAHMQSARIYATVQNVHTFAAYKGYNPDFQAGILNPGFDFGSFPRPRTTMLGIQIKF
ncbi:SusC/RagA family TonB-linked outer membrane protein [Neolewinella litorea]|uniref:TonB-dependent receptor n=1 Tax=Neolewinella litorea TaxID=2562452 RepID=A0A4S4NAG8_9BACT|nr:TonB-dependent receptor [Neolewinella litorea]THH36312.1 TonB-dependent receptor [Neolewinella litorea]